MKVGKLKQDGELLVSGVDTRSPLITDGLVAHYPFDGTTKGIYNSNILDYSAWVIGSSGSQAGFSQNGDGNSIVDDIGPFGESQSIWQSLGNDTTSDADGGWNSNQFNVDKTKKYRYSVWIRRKATGNSSAYFGCLGNSVYNITENTVNIDPYFSVTGLSTDEWRLHVAYIYPYDIGNIYPTDDAGIYNLSKTKIGTVTNFKHSPTATSNYHRTYLFYSTLATTNQQWVYPRVDLCDGTEPSIDDLLSCEGNVINPYSESNITKTNDYVGIEEATTNLIPSSIAFDSTVWSARENVTVTLNQLDPFGGYNAIKIHPNSTTDNYFGVRAAVLGIGTYTTSIWLRASKDCSVVLNTGTRSLTGAYITYTANLTREWRLFNYSGTTTVNPTHCFHIGAWNTWTDNTFDVFMMNPQVEQKAFATEYVNGSRSGDGTIVYNSISVGEDRGTIRFEAYIESYVYSTESYIDMFDFTTPESNRFLILRKSANKSVPETMFIRNGASYNTANISSKLIINEWNSIAWTWDINIGYTMSVNNVVVSASTSYTKSNLPSSQFIFRKGWKVRNLSIYNRALSDSEVTKISKGTHSFTQDGLITKSINTTGEIRYIRDYINGSTANAGNNWVEIKANTQDGINIALGKVPTSTTGLTNKSYITDGVISSAYSEAPGGLIYVQIDLGAMYLIDNIQIWHYYIDGRTYYNTRTQVSHDGVKWYDMFNSAIDGTYQETVNGKTHYVGGSGSSAMSAKVSGLTMNGINTTATL